MSKKLPNFEIMAKPIGPLCNLDCRYCFYKHKKSTYPKRHDFKMSSKVLAQFIREYISIKNDREISFAWQGGEPMLMGMEFFELVVSLQKKYCPAGKTITNIIQTNGTLIDNQWSQFLRKQNFLVGISIDGPQKLHDIHRVDTTGNPSFFRVIQAIELLQSHNVQFNTLTVVNNQNSKSPEILYEFLKDIGSGYIQFIPLVNFKKKTKHDSSDNIVCSQTVTPQDYGDFLCRIFDQWVTRDVGKVYVNLFETFLGIWCTGHSSLCTFSKSCGNNLILEHNGDLFSCDHYVRPTYLLGNIMTNKLSSLVMNKKQKKFSRLKNQSINNYCHQCDFFSICHGGCPKNHLPLKQEEPAGRNYLCKSYIQFFHHTSPYMEKMKKYINTQEPPSKIMGSLL